MRIAIVGRGRLGRSLAPMWRASAHGVELVGRGPIPDADVVVVAVPDASVADVAARIRSGPIVLHTSGSLDVEVLRPHSPAGSLHPLMTFPGPEVGVPDLDGVPAAIAGDAEAVTAARQLAFDLGMDPFEVLGDRRLYHAAAVISGNFATVLLADAAATLAAAGVPEDRCTALLAPLAIRSIANARHGVAAALTGPVSRGDEATLAAHRAALEEHGLIDVLGLYDALLSRARSHLETPERDDP